LLYFHSTNLGAELKAKLKRTNQKESIAKAIHSYNSKIADAMIELKFFLGSEKIKYDHSLPNHWKEFIKFYNDGNEQHFIDLYAALYSKCDLRTDLRLKAVSYSPTKKLKAFQTAGNFIRPNVNFTKDFQGIIETMNSCFASKTSKDRFRQHKDSVDKMFNPMNIGSKRSSNSNKTVSPKKKTKTVSGSSTNSSPSPKIRDIASRDQSIAVSSISNSSSAQLSIMEERTDTSAVFDTPIDNNIVNDFTTTDRESSGSVTTSTRNTFDCSTNPCIKLVTNLVEGGEEHWVYDEEAPLVTKVKSLISNDSNFFQDKYSKLQMKSVNLKSFFNDDLLATIAINGVSKAQAALQLQITYTEEFLNMYDKVSEVLSGRSSFSKEDITVVTSFLKENGKFRYYRKFNTRSYCNSAPSGHCSYLALHQMHLKTELDKKVKEPIAITDRILKNMGIKSPGSEEDRKFLCEFLDAMEAALVKADYKGSIYLKMQTCRDQLKKMEKGCKFFSDKNSWLSNNDLVTVPSDFAVVNLLQVTSKTNVEYIPKPQELDHSEDSHWGTLYMTNLLEKCRTSSYCMQNSCMRYNDLNLILGSSKMTVFEHGNSGGHYYPIPVSESKEEVMALDQMIDILSSQLLTKLASVRCLHTDNILSQRKSCVEDQQVITQEEDNSNFIFEVKELLLAQEKTIKQCLKRIEELESIINI
jgi:hypothetical protein